MGPGASPRSQWRHRTRRDRSAAVVILRRPVFFCAANRRQRDLVVLDQRVGPRAIRTTPGLCAFAPAAWQYRRGFAADWPLVGLQAGQHFGLPREIDRKPLQIAKRRPAPPRRMRSAQQVRFAVSTSRAAGRVCTFWSTMPSAPRVSSKNSKANRIETGERSGGIRRFVRWKSKKNSEENS